MGQFFDFNNVQNTQKVRIATLYLEPNQFEGINGFSLVDKLLLGQFYRRIDSTL